MALDFMYRDLLWCDSISVNNLKSQSGQIFVIDKTKNDNSSHERSRWDGVKIDRENDGNLILLNDKAIVQKYLLTEIQIWKCLKRRKQIYTYMYNQSVFQEAWKYRFRTDAEYECMYV